jgi:hypothetical protein
MARIFTEEHKRKIREKRKLQICLPHTEETKRKIGLANSISNPNKKYCHNIPHTEETKQKIREKRKLQTCSEETKQKMRDARIKRKKTLGYLNSPDARKKLSISKIGKKHRKHKPMTEIHLHNILRAVCTRPNKFEVIALNHLNTIYNNKFIYTGDGSFIVNHRSADAYSEELHTVALFNGTYWHLGKYGFENTEKAKGAIELIESIPFLEAGYRVIFIWEDELERIF